jgi:hypothetical protein
MPRLVVKRPSPQSRHCELRLAAGVSDHVFRGHSVQTTLLGAPSVAEYVPRSHGWQVACDVCRTTGE